MYCFKI